MKRKKFFGKRFHFQEALQADSLSESGNLRLLAGSAKLL